MFAKRPLLFAATFAAVSAIAMTINAQETGSDLPDFSDPRFDPAEVLNPAAFPDAPWAEALRDGQRRRAAALLVEELREGEPRIDLSESIPAIRQRWFNQRINENAGMDFEADDVVNLRYQGVYGITHEFENVVDWTYDGSHGRTPEWTWHLNRHLHWINLADAYAETGEPRFAQAWERELRSWVAQAPRPDDRGRGHGSPWRSLDTGIRAGSTWPYAFEIFRTSPHVSDEALWLFYCAQRENALHLLNHPAGGNWLVMETNGLGQASLMLSEVPEAETFLKTALERMDQELDRQFFPDGTHQEFAPHYAAAGCLANFYVLARQAERAGHEIPRKTWDALANIAVSLARIAYPDGMVPGVHNSRPFQIQGVFDDFVRTLDPDRFPVEPWRQDQSDLLPYGGYAVFRRPDRFSIFDAGPRGTSHYHDDDLQLLTWAYGSYFGVDPGSPLYTNEPISRHLRTSAAHNVVQMDGRRHQPAIEIPRPSEPVPLSFQGEGEVQAAAARRILLTTENKTFEHERVVLEIDGFGWAILDRLSPPEDSSRSWEWLWNLLVDDVTVNGQNALASHTGGAQMKIVTRGSLNGRFRVSAGESEPDLRGWINLPGTDDYRPMPALRFLSEAADGNVWLATIKVPFPSEEAVENVVISEAKEDEYRWTIVAEKGADEFRIVMAGDDKEVGKARVWRNGSEIGAVAFEKSHFLESKP